jgi:AraC-like DNA-binding protein
MKYREIAPIPELTPIVDCIWTLESEPGDAGGHVEPVLPDGCPELVMHFGDGFERVFPNGTSERQSDILFAGQLTSPLALRPTGVVATLGVRFRPGSAAAILRLPQQPLHGTTFGVDILDTRLSGELAAIRDGARSLGDAVDRIQGYLCTRLDSKWLDPRVLAAVGMIRRHHGQVGMDNVARRVEMTRRHLERQFDRTVGISPKRLARIVRFQRALRMLHARPERPGLPRPAGSGATTAIECGYADQPHFIRDFTELAGCPPGAHLLRHAQLSGFFRSAVIPGRPRRPALRLRADSTAGTP